ncbi:MAG: hypothetical protein J07HN4v3_01342 [Halonotius sp. J07HN4]|nr:MAG: hypothetical protein J07HN4v3_01342 [Halonotius sp. J07HN4]
MPLSVATPGVSESAARAAVPATENPTVLRATRCGHVPLATPVVKLVVCVRTCAISIHAATRVLDSLPAEVMPTVCVVDSIPVPQPLRERFDCPVRGHPTIRYQPTAQAKREEH